MRTTKILGITIDDSLKWDSHVDQICEKARKRIWILRRMMNVGLDYEIILDVYKKEIRSVLEYNSIIFHSGLTLALSEKIESIQRNFLRNLSSYLGIKLSYSEARILYGTELLSSRRTDQCYTWVKKHLSLADKGVIKCLFEKRDNFSQGTTIPKQ